MEQADGDWELLQRYASTGSDRAFAALVAAHAGMVYAVGLRQVRSPELAEEVAQTVFITLARKASTLGRGTVVAGWLHRTAVFTARNLIKREARRRRHEGRAAVMLATLIRSASGRLPAEPGWERLAPLLDDGVAGLREADRQAIVLRFFERHSLSEVGRAMGISEDAAQMRVSRAVGRLRAYFVRQGVTLDAGSLAGLVWVNAARAPVPPWLADSVLHHVRAAVVPVHASGLGETVTRAVEFARARAVATAVVMGTVVVVCWLTFVIQRTVIHGPPATAEPVSGRAVVWHD